MNNPFESIDQRLDKLEDLILALNQKPTQQIHDEGLILTREETCNFLKIDSSTLWTWTNKGKVKAYGIGHRRYYKKSELLESLTLVKKNTP